MSSRWTVPGCRAPSRADRPARDWFWFVLSASHHRPGISRPGIGGDRPLATALTIGSLILMRWRRRDARTFGVEAGAGSSCTCSPACCRSLSESCSCGRLDAARVTLLVACFLMVGGTSRSWPDQLPVGAWGWALAVGSST